MKSLRNRTIAVAALTLLIALAASLAQQPSRAMFIPGNDVPIDRVVANINAYLKNKPKDAQGVYLLGRIHALAYAEKTNVVRVFEEYAVEGKLPPIDENDIGFREKAPRASKEELRAFLAEAVKNYHAAIRLEPKQPLYYHSLASLLETAGDDLLTADVLPLYGKDHEDLATPEKRDALIRIARQGAGDLYQLLDTLLESGAVGYPLLKKLMADKDEEISKSARRFCADLWREETIEHYWKAYTLCTQKDFRMRIHYPVDYQVGVQSATAYVRLIHKRGPTDTEKHRLRQIEIDIGNLSPSGAAVITPIILHDAENKALADLLSDRVVSFDMNGDNLPDRCPWLKPDTALLVWDPNQTGQITSGRQLFGSVTWWIFWKDGYEALKALDDNQDGELTGKELQGLALWKDKNQNGLSEEGEVTPIEQTQIQSLSTQSTTPVSPGPSPANPEGLKLRNGKRLPTYDWTFSLNTSSP
jgi:hypothetical protein